MMKDYITGKQKKKGAFVSLQVNWIRMSGVGPPLPIITGLKSLPGAFNVQP